MIKACAWFNIVAGTVVTLAASSFTFFILAFGGFSFRAFIEAFEFGAPAILAGLLYVSSGVILLRSRSAVSGKGVIVLGLAVLAGAGYFFALFMEGALEGILNARDEEILLHVYVPAAFLLLVIFELGYLYWRWQCNHEPT
jgi:hypothetical protein